MGLDACLRTQRLFLRPLADDDVQPLWPYVSDPDFPRLMTWDAHRNIDETKNFVAMMRQAAARGTGIAWAILHENSLAGMMGLNGIVRTQRAWRLDRAELGYWIGPPHQRRGFATEAAREVLRYGFQSLDLHKIVVGCIKENDPSRRVIEKLGFRLVGEQRDHMFRFGRWWNHLSYELCIDEWRSSLG